nr:serine hydrolase domain-containing protein [uncultured Undibacterium sp.]
MMTTLRLLVLIPFLLSSVIAQAITVNSSVLQRDLQQMLSEERVAGAVLATVTPDKTTVSAVGYFDASRKIALLPESKVHVGSVTKTMLALTVLHLVSERRLDLDDTVESLLPSVSIRNPWRKTSPVRLRHLLDHTAGLEDLRLLHIFSSKITPDIPLADVFSRTPSVLRSRTEPGMQYSYSNLGYTLLGMVIETLVKERYETWADRQILHKIGMLDSTFTFTTQTGRMADKRLAWGHVDDLSTVAAQPVAVRPAGQFTTTAADMVKLAKFLMGDGLINGKPFIQKSLLQMLGQPSTTHAAQAGLPVGYGLGMFSRDRYGVLGLCHGGSVAGYRAMFCIYPAQQKAFFISHNTDSESARYSRFEERIVRELDLATLANFTQSPKFPNKVPALPLAPEWSGRYVHAPSRFELAQLADVLGSSVYLVADATPLTLQPIGGEVIQLTRVTEQLLQRTDRSVATHALFLDGQGQRFLIDHNGSMRKVHGLWYTVIWLSVGLGGVGLVYWLLVPPLRRIRQGTRLWQPAFGAVVLLLLSIALFSLQSWSTLGDLTLASGVLFVTSLVLPGLLIWQIVWAHRQPTCGVCCKCDIAAALLVLQWCVLLFAWDVLPLALWR